MSFTQNAFYQIQFGGSGGCLAALQNRDGSTPFPIRTKSCESSEDDTIFWQLDPDGQGRYFIYNKAWPGKSDRLDLVLQDTTSLYIPWMGPSGDVYNNQRWSVSKSGQIISFGLPGALLTVTEIQGQSSLGALLRNETEVSNDAGTWKVLDVSESKPVPEPSPEAPKPTSSKTDAQLIPIPTPTTLVTSRLPRSEQNILSTEQGDASISEPFTTRSVGGDLGGKAPTSAATDAKGGLTSQPTHSIYGSNTSPTATNQPPSQTSGSWNHGITGGIVAGAVVVILILLAICWKFGWLCWKGRRRPEQEQHPTPSGAHMGSTEEFGRARPNSDQELLRLMLEASNQDPQRQPDNSRPQGRSSGSATTLNGV
ncbi:hypothetical protein V8F20_007859 [Naviculisporaceae sp. PSN 640]